MREHTRPVHTVQLLHHTPQRHPTVHGFAHHHPHRTHPPRIQSKARDRCDSETMQAARQTAERVVSCRHGSCPGARRGDKRTKNERVWQRHHTHTVCVCRRTSNSRNRWQASSRVSWPQRCQRRGQVAPPTRNGRHRYPCCMPMKSGDQRANVSGAALG